MTSGIQGYNSIPTFNDKSIECNTSDYLLELYRAIDEAKAKPVYNSTPFRENLRKIPWEKFEGTEHEVLTLLSWKLALELEAETAQIIRRSQIVLCGFDTTPVFIPEYLLNHYTFFCQITLSHIPLYQEIGHNGSGISFHIDQILTDIDSEISALENKKNISAPISSKTPTESLSLEALLENDLRKFTISTQNFAVETAINTEPLNVAKARSFYKELEKVPFVTNGSYDKKRVSALYTFETILKKLSYYRPKHTNKSKMTYDRKVAVPKNPFTLSDLHEQQRKAKDCPEQHEIQELLIQANCQHLVNATPKKLIDELTLMIQEPPSLLQLRRLPTAEERAIIKTIFSKLGVADRQVESKKQKDLAKIEAEISTNLENLLSQFASQIQEIHTTKHSIKNYYDDVINAKSGESYESACKRYRADQMHKMVIKIKMIPMRGIFSFCYQILRFMNNTRVSARYISSEAVVSIPFVIKENIIPWHANKDDFLQPTIPANNPDYNPPLLSQIFSEEYLIIERITMLVKKRQKLVHYPEKIFVKIR